MSDLYNSGKFGYNDNCESVSDILARLKKEEEAKEATPSLFDKAGNVLKNGVHKTLSSDSSGKTSDDEKASDDEEDDKKTKGNSVVDKVKSKAKSKVVQGVQKATGFNFGNGFIAGVGGYVSSNFIMPYVVDGAKKLISPKDEETKGDETKETKGDETKETKGDETKETKGDETKETKGDETKETKGDETKENATENKRTYVPPYSNTDSSKDTDYTY